MNFLTLIELLRYRSLHQPQRLAYSFLQDGEIETDRLTYKELDLQARAIGAYLQSIGALGQRALLLYPPGLDLTTGFFGCLYGGAIAVTAYVPRSDQSLSKLEAIATSCQAKLILTTKSLLPYLETRFSESPQLANIQLVVSDSIDSNLASKWEKPDLNDNNLALLQYTSGSTGNPKGVMLNHGNVLHNLAMMHEAFQITPETRFVSWMPLNHNSGLIAGALLPVYGNFPVFMMSPLDFLQKPSRWLMTISSYKATMSFGPNFAYELACSKITSKEREHLDLSSWELAICGAEVVRAETIEKFARTFADRGFRSQAFNSCYGMAESVVFISGHAKMQQSIVLDFETSALQQNRVVVADRPDSESQKIVGCGSTWLEQKILIVNPETFTPCLTGQIGEIWVSSPSVASGYWQQPEATQKTFQAYLTTGEGPFLRSGDLGFLLDRQLFVAGRLKDLIVIRGRNHYPQDIELTVEKSYPALRSSNGAAFSVDVDSEEKLVVAQEIEDDSDELDIDKMAQAICQNVSQQHELQVYAILFLKSGTIPKTTSGKIQRQACRLGFLDDSLNVVGKWQQKSLLEPASYEYLSTPQNLQDKQAITTWLIHEIARLLKVEAKEIDIHTSLSNYGLDSVQAVSIASEIENAWDRKLSPSLLWDYPTIDRLTRYLTNESDRQVEQFTIDLDKEAILDNAIRPDLSYIEVVTEPNNIFLTGATGFLGAFLLQELLKKTSANIYCLVRSPNYESGKLKIQNNLAAYGLWDGKSSDCATRSAKGDRIIPVLGDLSKPRLGLDREEFQKMSSSIDTIYHSAALLNYVYPYSQFKPANVLGTQEIIRLASQTKVKPLHYISSVAVFESSAYYSKVITESDSLSHNKDIYLGYSQSKWVAEKLVMSARDRGLPVTIYRPPFISGDTKTGVWNTDDIVCRLIKGCIQMGSMPDIDFLLDLSPVDYVSRAIVYLSQQQQSLGKAFHLNNPQPLHWKDLVSFIRDSGYPIEQVSYRDWQTQLDRDARTPENPLYPLLPFFFQKWTSKNLTAIELHQQDKNPKISCQETIKKLAISDIFCPRIDRELLNVYFSYFRNKSFLNMHNKHLVNNVTSIRSR
jgi:thioester reductase-like protein